MVGFVLQLVEKGIIGALVSLRRKESFLLHSLVISADFKNRVEALVLLIGIVHEFIQHPVLVTEEPFEHLRIASDVIHIWRVLWLTFV
jgi:hypothetical protein